MMSNEQAIEEGRKRWGSNSAINHGNGCFAVGVFFVVGNEGFSYWKGFGASWEEAFQDCDSHPRQLEIWLRENHTPTPDFLVYPRLSFYD